jgi:AraC-like DNA-binding protein
LQNFQQLNRGTDQKLMICNRTFARFENPNGARTVPSRPQVGSELPSRLRDNTSAGAAAKKARTTYPWEELAAKAKYDLRALEKLAQCSARQLRRRCRDSTGLSPRKFLDALRIIDAQERLLRGEFPKEFADLLRFKTISHFYRHFRLQTKMTPAQFLAKTQALPNEEQPAI